MTRKRPRLACLGDLTLDIVVRAVEGVATGTDAGGEIRLRVGGSAANTARAFAGLGGQAAFIGAVGDDELGRRLKRAMREAGVAVRVVRVRGRSARLLALIDAAGERSFVTDRGVADSLTPRALKMAWLARIDALHVPAYSLLNPPLADASLAAIGRARSMGALVSIDLASEKPLLARGRPVARELIRAAEPDVLFANAAEARALLGSAPSGRLLDFAPLAVVKQGARGCRVLWRTGVGEASGGGRMVGQSAVGQSAVATRRLAVTDTTGAGDDFDAGFLHALLVAGYAPGMTANATTLRRAALAGHRAAAKLLTSHRKELLT